MTNATTQAPARNWLNAPKHFRGSYLKGKVAAMEGKTKRDCPYDNLEGHATQTHAQAWLAGFESVEKKKVKA